MSNPADKQSVSDEELVAYLDGELSAGDRAVLEAKVAADAEVKARLERLARGGRDFAAAFDRLFDDAPAERLAAMLQRVEAESKTRRVAARRGWRPSLMAASVALLIVGGAIGYLAASLTGEDEDSQPGYWREVVAEYVALYTSETFAGIPDNAPIQAAMLADAGRKLSLDLAPEKVALPGLALKGAIIFNFRDKPLAQIAYLSPRDGPIAFCIIANGQASEPISFETREGKNVVYWGKGGRGYLVIGSAPREELEAYAATLNDKVS